MIDPSLADHLAELGAEPRDEALTETFWARLGLEAAALPSGIRELVEHYAGTGFCRGAVLERDGRVLVDVGWLLDPDELVEAWDDTREDLPASMLPFADDGGGDHVCVDLGSGGVFVRVHDAPLDRRVRPVAGSVEEFIIALRPTDEEE